MLKRLLRAFFYALFILGALDANSQAFVTIWQTDNFGSSADNQITIPTEASETYLYDVAWVEVGTPANNGTVLGNTGDVTITFPSAGTYRVTITGLFPRIFFQGLGDDQKIIEVEEWGNNPWTSMELAFKGCVNLQITASDAPDLSAVTSMSEMFRFASSLNADLSAWDVSNVTDMSNLFSGASIFNQPLNTWDVSNVTDMSFMFNNAGDFDQPLNLWNVSSVTDMTSIFGDAKSFNQNINSWDVSSVTSMVSMFNDAEAFNQPLDSWDVSSALDMSDMFRDAALFNQPLDSWNVSNVTDLSGMFRNCTDFDQPLNSWNVANVTNMNSLFSFSSFNQDLSSWNVSNVTNMAFMFAATPFNQNIGGWDVSSVTTFNQMFSVASDFNQDLGSWDISSATDLLSMFASASSFNQDISGWNTSNITDMRGVFRNAVAFDQDITGWDVSSVTRMSGMFDGAILFNQDISVWNVSNVTEMDDMFANNPIFNQDISGWDVSNVNDFNSMFSGASAFNQDISGWDVSGANDMRNMFEGAVSFDQDLGGWDVSGVSLMFDMFDNSGLSLANYDNLWIGWDALPSLQSGVNFGAQGLFYCQGETARANIIGTYGWFVTDEGTGCVFVYDGPTILDPQILNGQSTPIDYGSTPVGSPKIRSFTIENNLSVDQTNITVAVSGAEFITSAVPFTITAGSSSVISIDLAGTGIGSYTETVSITSDFIGVPFTFDVIGEVTAGPESEIKVFEGTGLSGSQILDGQPFPYFIGEDLRPTDVIGTFTIENLGSADLNITTISVSGTAFSVSDPGPLVILAGNSQVITVTLDGSVAGQYTESIVINSDDVSEPAFTFDVEGLIRGPEIHVYDGNEPFIFPEILNGQIPTIDFGSTSVGSDVTREISVANFGPVPLDISSFTISPGPFSVTPGSAVVPAELDGVISWQVFTITFDSSTPGGYFETVTINSDDDATPVFTFDLEGTVSGSSMPEIAVFEGVGTSGPEILDGQASAVNFGSQIVGSDLDFTFTIENSGSVDLTINDITVTGTDFSVLPPLPVTVSVVADEQFTVRLTGAAEGIFNATLTIDNDDVDEGTFNFPITGQITAAAAPEISVYDGPDSSSPEIMSGQATPIDFGTVVAGTDNDRQITIENLGTAVLNVSSIAVTGSSITVVGAPVSVNVGTETTFTLRMNNPTAGNIAESVTITTDDADESSFTFVINATVTEANTAPTITAINDIIINEDGSTGAIDFVIGDSEQGIATLIVSATSDNQTLVPNANITIEGIAPDLTVTAIPLANQSGVAIITLEVNDGITSTFETFTVTVSAVNDIPLITGQNALETPQNTGITLTLNDFTVTDIDNSFPTGFSLAVLAGSNYSVSVSIVTPDADFTGTLTVPVTVNDGTDDSPPFDAIIDVLEVSVDVILDGVTQLSGTDIIFPDALVGTSVVEDLTISNTGSADLVISDITIDGGDFTLTSPVPGPIASGSSAAIQITFAPLTVGPKVAVLTIISNNPEDFMANLRSNGLSELPPIEVYNAVSTNGDGKNDFFQILNIEFYPVNNISIFDRLGREVYRTSGYNNTDNNFIGLDKNGTRIPDGTYYYVLEYDDGNKRKQGFLLLSR